MENIELSKTSDEIINELFSSLNVPLSPKPVEVEEKPIKGDQVSAHTGDSDNSEDDETDSKSSESEGETKATIKEVSEESKTDVVEKTKPVKKKKDKRKKKKKHKKKEDGGRHKHKKKKKKENFETAEEAKLAADVLQDDKVKNQAFIQKIIQEEFRQLDIRHCKTNQKCKESLSPKLHQGSKSPDAPETLEALDEKEKKRPQKTHTDTKIRETATLHQEAQDSSLEKLTGFLSHSHSQKNSESCKVSSSVPSKTSEQNASKQVSETSPKCEASPGRECVSGREPTHAGPIISGSQKRKQSPQPHSPSPTRLKKVKSSHHHSPSPPCLKKPTSPSHHSHRSQSPKSLRKTKSLTSGSSKSSSPKTDSQQRSPSHSKRSRSGSPKDSKSESGSKVKRSRSGSRKRSRSKRSRSHSRKRSTSKSKKLGGLKRSMSRSRSRSRSRKRSKSRSKRSRSRKRSKSRSKRSRSKSRRRSRSRKRSGSKSERKSRSRKRSSSKSRRGSHSKSRRSRSKSRSGRSKSNSKRESASKNRSGGRSKSRSRKRSHSRSRSRRRTRSRSKSAKRSRSRRKSGSRSRSQSSPKSSPAKERFDMFAVMRERANRLAELKSQGIPDGSLGSLLLSSVPSLPIPTPDPSSIPLPLKDSHPTDASKDVGKEEGGAEGEEGKAAAGAVGAVTVVEEPVIAAPQGHDANRPKEATKGKQDEGNEKGKTKTVITIKSLKGSIVFQQAQEEAERKAKERVDQPVAKNTSPFSADPQQEARDQHQDEVKQNERISPIERNLEGETSRRGTSEESDGRKTEESKEVKERRKDEEKQRRESQTDESIRKPVDKETNDIEKFESKGEEKKMKQGEYVMKKTVNKLADREDDKVDNDIGAHREEKRKEIKNGMEEEKEKLKSEEGTRHKQLSKSGEKEERESKLPSKRDEKEECKRSKSSKAEEEKGGGSKHSNKTDEEELAVKIILKTEAKHEIKKQSSKDEEKDDAGKEDESKKSKVTAEADEKEEEQISKQSSETQEKYETNESQPSSKNDCEKNGQGLLEQDSDKVEEGEIVSDTEETVTKSLAKTHSKKKSKKDKSSTKEKKKSHRDKSKNKDEKKKAREKKKEQERARSHSKERHRSRQHTSSSSKDKEHSSHSRRHRRRSRSRSHSRTRSHSRDRSSRQHRRSHSRSRSKSRSKRRRESTSDLRDKVTRKRLLEIARRNAVYLMQNGCLPPSVEQEQLVKIKAGGKSVDELTDFCKQLVASGNYSDVDVSEPSMSSEEENNTEKPFSSTRHPFSVRDSKPIMMNIRNAPMLPTKTNAERLAGQAKLREQFPVSSGSQHRTKGEMSSSDGKHLSESEWVPVPPKEKKGEDKVFTKPEVPPVDISQIVSTRLSAMRKLQDNPNDSEAIKALNNVQKEMQNWALSKQEPGQFTGTTGVKVLSQEELSSGHQAWARKEQFKEAAPVRPQFGLKMLQKMGWSPGEGLGKNKEGTTEPLLLDVKMDKKGFHAQEEVTPKKQPVPLVKDLSGKHPVSALVELCSKRKWSPPDFEMVFDCGPDHKKNFLMKVMVNGQEFKPSVAASTKKMAKANAAAAYLQSLGLYPKDPHHPL